MAVHNAGISYCSSSSTALGCIWAHSLERPSKRAPIAMAHGLDAQEARKGHTELAVPSQGRHRVRRCPGVAWPGQGAAAAPGGTSRDILSPPG